MGSSHTNEIHIKTMRCIPLFKPFTDDELKNLSKFIFTKKFLKNDMVLSEEDTPKYMYFVYWGKVKVVQTSPEGKEHILTIHKAGEFFGEMSILDGMTSPATVIALEDSLIGLLSKTNFEKYFLTNNKFLKELISTLCMRLREAWLIQKILSFSDAEKRIRILLNHLGKQFGTINEKGTIINLKLTHKDIADYSSLSRETVTRFLDKLIKNGEIEYNSKQILLKPSFIKNIPIL